MEICCLPIPIRTISGGGQTEEVQKNGDNPTKNAQQKNAKNEEAFVVGFLFQKIELLLKTRGCI